MAVQIEILEETFSIKSVLSDNLLESCNDILNSRSFFIVGLSTTVLSEGTCVGK